MKASIKRFIKAKYIALLIAMRNDGPRTYEEWEQNIW